jgi:phosphonate metabolism protein (transferase hexapeptide repeat family)
MVPVNNVTANASASSHCHEPAENGEFRRVARRPSMTIKMLSPTALVHPTAEVRDSRLGAYTAVGARTKLLEVEMDDYSYVVNDSDIAYATIGRFCSIAAMTRINPGNHPMDRASQSHFTYRASAYFPGERDEDEFFAWRRAQPVAIAHDVWVGHGAIVLPGRSVGIGAVVAAGAVVTKDVAPYAIVAGNPARVIRPRFPADIADRLIRLAWWDWSHEQLRVALPDFRHLPIEGFLAKHETTLVDA